MRGTPIITLWQPWATWIAYGAKTVESRKHDKLKGLVGKRIGIHAGLKMEKCVAMPKDADTFGLPRFKQEYPRGAILCTAFVWAFDTLGADDAEDVCMQEVDMYGRYGLFLEDVVTFEPYYVKGKQGIWYSKEFDAWLARQ